MTPLTIFLLILAALVETLAAYITRVYSEFGKILSREVQDNIDAWEEKVEPHLGLSRERDGEAVALRAVKGHVLTRGQIGITVILVARGSEPRTA